MSRIISEEIGSKLDDYSKCRCSVRLSPSGSDALFGILNIVEEGITQFLSKKIKIVFFFPTYGTF